MNLKQCKDKNKWEWKAFNEGSYFDLTKEEKEFLYKNLVMKHINIKPCIQKQIKFWATKKEIDRRNIDAGKARLIYRENCILNMYRNNIWWSPEKIIETKKEPKIFENEHTMEEDVGKQMIKERITIWEIDWSCFINIWKKNYRTLLYLFIEKGKR
jgi:hypothetical protein